MLNQNIMRQRVRRFIAELDISVTKFCIKMGFSRTAYYRWLKNDLTFSDKRAEKIDEHLKQYGF